MKKIFLTNFVFCLCLFSTFSNAEDSIKRVQSMIFDKGSPQKIYLHPGLGSVITFPCFVSDSFLGDESQAEIRPSPSNRKIILLSLKSQASRATNLIVRCEGQLSHFVIDIVPSNKTHQDVLEIRAAFGRPELMPIQSEIAASNNKNTVKNTTKNTVQEFNSRPRKIVISAPEIVLSRDVK